MSWDHEDWNDRIDYAREVERRGPMEPTADHVRLLARVCWSWDEAEFGAAAVDAKRPYGNSDVENNLEELLPHLSAEERVRRHCEIPAVLDYVVRAYVAKRALTEVQS